MKSKSSTRQEQFITKLMKEGEYTFVSEVGRDVASYSSLISRVDATFRASQE